MLFSLSSTTVLKWKLFPIPQRGLVNAVWSHFMSKQYRLQYFHWGGLEYQEWTLCLDIIASVLNQIPPRDLYYVPLGKNKTCFLWGTLDIFIVRVTWEKLLPWNPTYPWHTLRTNLIQLSCTGLFLNLALRSPLNLVGIFCFNEYLTV